MFFNVKGEKKWKRNC